MSTFRKLKPDDIKRLQRDGIDAEKLCAFVDGLVEIIGNIVSSAKTTIKLARHRWKYRNQRL